MWPRTMWREGAEQGRKEKNRGCRPPSVNSQAVRSREGMIWVVISIGDQVNLSICGKEWPWGGGGRKKKSLYFEKRMHRRMMKCPDLSARTLFMWGTIHREFKCDWRGKGG